MHISKKTLTLLVSLVAILAMSVGSTLAWLAASGGELENKFEIGLPTVEIKEDFDGLRKEKVKVTNNSDIPMYVRVNLVFTWTDASGNTIEKPENAKLNITYGDLTNKWLEGSDGYYYYKTPLQPGDSTANIINEATITVPQGSGYGMTLEVLAQSIQADPAEAVQQAWGVEVADNGNITIS